MTALSTPEFKSAIERQEWIIRNASYFTAFRMLGRKRQRLESKSLEGVRQQAAHLLTENPKPVLIYAVSGINDTYVETIGL